MKTTARTTAMPRARQRNALAAIAGSLWLGPAFAQPAFVPVTDAMLQDPDPADWPMWRRTLDTFGFSPLDQIDRKNVARLGLAWSYRTGKVGS